jgi:hypothetical protein
MAIFLNKSKYSEEKETINAFFGIYHWSPLENLINPSAKKNQTKQIKNM